MAGPVKRTKADRDRLRELLSAELAVEGAEANGSVGENILE